MVKHKYTAAIQDHLQNTTLFTYCAWSPGRWSVLGDLNNRAGICSVSVINALYKTIFWSFLLYQWAPSPRRTGRMCRGFHSVTPMEWPFQDNLATKTTVLTQASSPGRTSRRFVTWECVARSSVSQMTWSMRMQTSLPNVTDARPLQDHLPIKTIILT